MNDRNFIEGCTRTESTMFALDTDQETRLLHASMGMVTEAGEFMDALKKSLFYDKPLDTTNLKEEIGDMLWYMAIAMDALYTDFDTEQTRVINKLKVRYPEKFTSFHAEYRDLEAERKVLEHPNQGDLGLDDEA